ncbi:MAG: N-acetylmuramoyl-L-alanine amidase [Peptoniphilaceae bacterium]
MKKTILYLILILFFVTSNVEASSNFKVIINNKNVKVSDVSVVVDGKEIKSDFKPYNLNSRTFVPIRELTEGLGANVKWDNKIKSATIELNNKRIKLKIDSNIVYVNDKKIKLNNDSVPRFAKFNEPKVETKTMVPLRFLSEAMDYKVSWNGDSQQAIISTVKVKDKESVSKVNSTSDESNNSNDKNKNDLIKESKPVVETANKAKSSFISNTEKIETNKVEDKDNKEAYKAAGLTIEDLKENKEKRTISKKIKAEGPITIVIDPGHGGKDSGAIVDSGLKEKDLNLQVAKILNNKLKSRGYETIMTRTEDEYIKLLDRASVSNKLNSELFLSIHFNSSDNREAKGIEVLYASESKVIIKSTEQKYFADELLKALLEETESNSRGIKNRPDLVVLNKTKSVSALAELGFMSNPDDYDKIIDEEYIEKLANGLFKGIENYKIKYIENN